MTDLFYLAYGSNLHPLRLMERVPSARVIGVVGIPGRSIAFHKRGADGSGKCDLLEDASPALSHGVLYEFSSRHKAALDAVEGSGRGYDEFMIGITLADVVHHPYTYLAGASHIDDALRPFDWYKALVEAASRESLTLIVGAPVRSGPRLHIGALILAPGGVIELYTKHHLGAFPETAGRDGVVPPGEDTVFDPGDRNPLVRIGDAAAAVAVCADIGRLSHPRQAANRGARFYLASMFLIPPDFEGDAAKLRGYAAGHALVVALANFGGATGGLAAAGRSSIWSASGDLVARLEPSGSGVAVATGTAEGWKAETVMLGKT